MNIIFLRVFIVCNSFSSVRLSSIQLALLSEVTGSAGFRPISFSNKMERITLSTMSDTPNTPYHFLSFPTFCCGSLASSYTLRKRIRLSGCRFVFVGDPFLSASVQKCVDSIRNESQSKRRGFTPHLTPHHAQSFFLLAFTMAW